MNAKLDWADLQLLVAVRAAGSMLRAGRRLGLAASTVSRRVDALEHTVGVLLLERGPGGVRFTPAGRVLAECGGDLELHVARALRDLPRAGHALTGTVRVSAGDGFAQPILAAVATTRREHPGVTFELTLENRVVDLTRREADVGVRTLHERESSLVYRKVSSLEYGVFAGAGYLSEKSAPRRAAELSKHDWIALAPPLDGLPAQRWLRAQCGRAPTLATTTFAALLEACRAGLGVAVLPLRAASGLARILPETELPTLPVWLVADQHARHKPHIAAFIEILRSQLVREE